MKCRIVDLRNKDVININTGRKLGTVGDVEVDTCTAKLVAVVIYGKPKLFGLLGHEDDCVVCWDDIAVIGQDSVLVKCDLPPRNQGCDCPDECQGCRYAGGRRSGGILGAILGEPEQ